MPVNSSVLYNLIRDLKDNPPTITQVKASPYLELAKIENSSSDVQETIIQEHSNNFFIGCGVAIVGAGCLALYINRKKIQSWWAGQNSN